MSLTPPLRHTPSIEVMRTLLLSLVIAVIAQLCVSAQMYVTRNAIFDPFRDTSVAEGFLPAVNYSHEFSRGYGSANDELAWNGRAIGTFEFYRWAGGFSLGAVMAAEAGINSHNDISFNPRSIRWLEELTLYYKRSGFLFETGVQHQCKHDVDNSDGPRGDAPMADRSEKRVTILSGVHAGVQYDLPAPSGQSESGDDSPEGRVFLRADYYPFSSDYRFPENNSGRDLTNLSAAILAGAKYQLPVYGLFSVYASVWSGTVFFGRTSQRDASGTPEHNYRLEFGTQFRGRGGKLEVFLASEKYFDDLSSPVPQSSKVLYLGLRGSGKSFL